MNDETIQTVTPSKEDLDKLVRNHMIAAFGAGLVPIPVADLAAMTAVQINLVRKIASCFEVPFSRNAVKSIIGALLGGAVVPAYGAPLLASLAKAIPVAGGIIGLAAMPTISAAMTYAVGHVFIQHFESGGTLLTFDTKKAGELFKRLFKKGQEEAEVMSDLGEDENEKAAPVKSKKRSKKPRAKS
jgi:uncharacterized protein (DUF697 family)